MFAVNGQEEHRAEVSGSVPYHRLLREVRPGAAGTLFLGEAEAEFIHTPGADHRGQRLTNNEALVDKVLKVVPDAAPHEGLAAGETGKAVRLVAGVVEPRGGEVVVRDVVIETQERRKQVLPLARRPLQVPQVGDAQLRDGTGTQSVEQRLIAELSGQRPFLLLILNGEKDKRFVPLDGPADGAPKLVAGIEGWGNRGVGVLNEGGSNQAVGLEEPVYGAVPVIGARLGDHVDQAAGGMPEFRREPAVAHLELLDGVLGKGEVLGLQRPEPLPEEGVALVHAIDEEPRKFALLAVQAHRRPQPRAGIGGARQLDKVAEVPAADGQLFDIGLVDDHIGSALALVNRAGLRRHHNLFGCGAKLQAHVLNQFLSHGEPNFPHDGGGEAALGDLDPIFPHRQHRRRVATITARAHLALGARGHVNDSDRRPRDYRPAGIINCSCDGALFQELAGCRKSNQQSRQDGEKSKPACNPEFHPTLHQDRLKSRLRAFQTSTCMDPGPHLGADSRLPGNPCQAKRTVRGTEFLSLPLFCARLPPAADAVQR